MSEWLNNNIGTLLAAAVLLAIVVAIIIGMIRRKKSGQSVLDCGGNCGSCGGACSQSKVPKKYKDLIKTVIGIDGMMCGMCESHINDAIRNSFKVETVYSSHKKGETVVLSKEPLNKDMLISTIEKTGYIVTSYSSEQMS